MADDELSVDLPEGVTAAEVSEVSDIQVRDAAKREIEVRLLPWDMTVETSQGPETFVRGATLGTKQDGVLLMGLEHEAHMGIGQAGQPVLTRRPAGRSTSVWEADDGPHVAFRVARTQAGDEILALAEDGIVRGVSVEFKEVPGGTTTVNRGGRRVRVHNRVALTGASMTYRPAYGEQAAVLAVRSQPEEAPVAETETAAAPATEPAAPVLDIVGFNAAVASMGDTITRSLTPFADRLAAIEENARTQIVIPGRNESPEISRGQWMKTVLRALSGEPVPELQTRVMADLVTSDNLGVVPEAFSPEMIGIIDAGRPFLGSTRRIPTPDSGMTLNMPIIETRPTAGVQVNEKDDITSTVTSITSTGFDAITIAGGGDLSLQILKRSSPSFLDLYLQLLAEALSENAEAEAIAALLAAGVTAGTSGGANPDALAIGEAWGNARAARQKADTIWLGSDAVAAYIDAKVDGTNAPLYSNLAADITVGGGPRGTVSGLRPVYVPALDDTAVDVIVGPSRGFAWAEDGAFTLQTDVPSKAGRDVALVVIDWYAPLYPSAFTTYALT